MRKSVFWVVVSAILTTSRVCAQWWDPGSAAGDAIAEGSHGKLKLAVESRGRYERRTGNNFGKDPGTETGLIRTRLSLSYQPMSWLRFSGMLQDSRAPWYGPNAPDKQRDPGDLHEAYFELFPSAEQGFGMTAGRGMLNYGEGRLIGTPQWGNLSRTYDQARLSYRTRKARLEFLLVSPVKIRIGEFNVPVLGDRVWGAYSAFPDFWRKQLLEIYALRHDQNRIGGFTGGNSRLGTDRLKVNTFGFRLTGPLPAQWKYSFELALQNGKVGPAGHLGQGWASTVSRRWSAKHPLDFSGEYKYASGSPNPSDPLRSRTFDQLYAANHDKFGHEDLLGWRNLHDVRSLATFGITRNLALNVMYNAYWLASARDSLYSGSGRSLARSPDGTAGRFVGQEGDLFITYKFSHYLLGAGYGHLFAGGFLKGATPGISPTYLYVFHTYTF